MNEFQKDLQNLNVGQFTSTGVTPLSGQNQYYAGDPRLCVGICFFCAGFCGGFCSCSNCFRCSSCFSCAGCARCGSCARCR
ncbi:heterocycloanthracin/sonorensin family bacteriocin [Paenibacillus sp. VCA1]|uniref:heterocycloanthracin/sonorensin family bacteriocin n=1 Tax=Paenibacillus sp. VCA1 TaxID=3039148 RepID=UPI0028719C76|nr:heterocycloanthracin/sonorensin family bacteriocin [Paenibacillus sp. VCA1]MDR9855444.1 heterocycloanthracin/sonorensin family bacteriocin [Paenibacillus sp. VCA1]